MRPHVFVLPGDITHLACDAWLLPTDRRLSVRWHWREAVPTLTAALDALGPQGDSMRAAQTLALPLPDWDPSSPLPVLVAVPYAGVQDAADVVAPASEALRRAAQAVADHRRTKRPLPLLALPAFATEGGGGDSLRGAVLQRLHDVAAEAAAAYGVDVALVLPEPADLAVLQRWRRDARAGAWPELGPLVSTAQSLATRAQSGVLVPFIGAGVSASAGLPLWKELVSRLQSAVQLPLEEAASFEQLDVLDQAHVLRLLYASDGIDFPAAVARETESALYGLAPVLLAALPTREAVTLNYDTLYERASEDIGRPVASLPEDVVQPGERWLLKLHGSVTDPASIVLTRDDYLGYGRGREALSSLAKAMLLTKHLLFVGFGLADDHFHALMHDVRAVLPAEKRAGAMLGTALVLGREPLQQRLWGQEIDLISLTGEDVAVRARLLEVFLDCVLAHADAKSPFFLDARYQHDMPEAERRLRERLLRLSREVTAEESALPAWQPVRDALEELGLPADA